MLSDTQRSMKRTMARDGMVRKYDEIILRYANVQPFIPRVDDIVPKNIWERQMQRARELLRSIQVCDEEVPSKSVTKKAVGKIFTASFVDFAHSRSMSMLVFVRCYLIPLMTVQIVNGSMPIFFSCN